MGADDLMRSTEARAQQGPVIASPPPTMNTYTSAYRAAELSMQEIGSNGKLSGDLLQPDPQNTRSEYDIEVHVDTSMIRDPR